MCCVCAFLLHRRSPDMILGDKPLMFEMVLSQMLMLSLSLYVLLRLIFIDGLFHVPFECRVNASKYVVVWGC
jgi:hypothetical protein